LRVLAKLKLLNVTLYVLAKLKLLNVTLHVLAKLKAAKLFADYDRRPAFCRNIGSEPPANQLM
jgi:hypothetical protein